jgi:hypothetical protein
MILVMLFGLSGILAGDLDGWIALAGGALVIFDVIEVMWER